MLLLYLALAGAARNGAARYDAALAGAARYDTLAALRRVDAFQRRSVAARVRLNTSPSGALSALAAALRFDAKRRAATIWVIRGESVDTKASLHARMIKSILLRSNSNASLVYVFQNSASGRKDHGDDCGGAEFVPRFAIASKAGRCTDVLVPNPYFGDIHAEWRPEYDRLTASAKRAKWEARDERVFWRGKLGGLDADAGNTSCEREAGNYARLDAATVGLGDAKAFDIKITHCKPRDDVSRPCARLPLNARHHEAISNSCAKIIGSPVTHSEYASYQFLADLPGSISGSYSRNLNYLWLLGAVVLQWHAGYAYLGAKGARQWYTAGLENGTTHLDVRATNVAATVKAVKGDAAWANQLVENGRLVAETFLRPAALSKYVSDLFQDVERRQNLGQVNERDLALLLEGGVSGEGCGQLRSLVRVGVFSPPVKGPRFGTDILHNEPALYYWDATPSTPLQGKDACKAFRQLFFPK
ncbi:hypothetical protein M885DRAFT_522894 [Pelagophyceae sp. CCMP2097]|nr:hypothetical protein M885DRAFT_522894 [Pelagophyceae sp. CCMP2097]